MTIDGWVVGLLVNINQATNQRVCFVRRQSHLHASHIPGKQCFASPVHRRGFKFNQSISLDQYDWDSTLNVELSFAYKKASNPAPASTSES